MVFIKIYLAEIPHVFFWTQCLALIFIRIFIMSLPNLVCLYVCTILGIMPIENGSQVAEDHFCVSEYYLNVFRKLLNINVKLSFFTSRVG
jgi:hypothetical protein